MHEGSSAGKPAATDLETVSRVLAGDPDAGSALVQSLRPVIARVVRGRATRRNEESDLMQMVYLNVFANLDQFSGRVPLAHWVSRIAVNVCLKQYRHEHSRPELRRSDLTAEQEQMLDFLATSDRDVSPPQQMAATELGNALLGQLKTRERLMVNLLYLEGRTISETCAMMGMSNLAVRLLAFRARKKMKKIIDKLQNERGQ